jgi:hypothetical protein
VGDGAVSLHVCKVVERFDWSVGRHFNSEACARLRVTLWCVHGNRMSQELIYTSAPRGLKPGSRGFCTVAATAGMPPPLVERLESLSGYRPLFPAGDPSAHLNPVSYAHWKLSIGGRSGSVLSRVAFAGFDYTQRSNKIAHHLYLDVSEQPPAGPAWVMLQPGVLESQWEGEPSIIHSGRKIPDAEQVPAPCGAWRAATGDAGWAGVLAASFVADPEKPAYIIYKPGTEILPLLNEAILLLPRALRWEVTFNTYFNELPAGLGCAWRCCVVGSASAAVLAKRGAASLIVDLTEKLPTPQEGGLVQAARTGRVEEKVADIEVDDAGASPEDLRAKSVLSRIPPKRLSTQATSEESSDTDQSWMPPISATIIEREDNPQRDHISRLIWRTIAVAWPLIIGVAVVLFVRPQRGSNPGRTSAKVAVPEGVFTEQQVQQIEARARAEELAKAEARIADINKQHEVQRAKQVEALQQSEKTGAKQREEIEELKRRPQQPETSAASPPVAEQTSPQEVRPKVPDATSTILPHDLPKAEAGSHIITLGKLETTVVQAAKLAWRFPNGGVDQDELHVEADPEVMRIVRRFKPKGGLDPGLRTDTLATLRASPNTVDWQWGDVYLKERTPRRKEWDDAIGLSQLEVDRGGIKCHIQFVPLHRVKWNIADAETQQLVKPPARTAETLVLAFVGDMQPWQIASAGSPLTVDFKCDDARFFISFEATSAVIKSDWKLQNTQCQNDLMATKSRLDELKAIAVSADRHLEELRKAPNSNEDSEPLKGARAALDKARANESELRSRYDRMAASGKAFRATPALQVLVKLPNDVTLAAVNLSAIASGTR